MQQPSKPTTIPLLHFNKSNLIPPSKPKQNSVLFSNRLTRSYFSLHDTSLQHRHPINKNDLRYNQHHYKGITAANSKLLSRFHSQNNSNQNSQQYQNITQAYIPKIVIKRNLKSSSTAELQRNPSNNLVRESSINNKNNKFKLLFREAHNRRKSISERKIDRLSRKIEDIGLHNRYLSGLVPKVQAKISIQKKRVRGTEIQLQRIKKLVRILIRNINIYFSMYEHPKKVADLLKSVEGYNEILQKILLKNSNQAKKITTEQQILNHFWASYKPSQRPQHSSQQDIFLFNILQNYTLKMQKSYTQIKKHFIEFQQIKIQKLKKQINNKLIINSNKMNNILLANNLENQNENVQKQLEKIIKFVDSRKRHNQDRRESVMVKLEGLGVRFNVEQRSKQLIFRERQIIIKATQQQY